MPFLDFEWPLDKLEINEQLLEEGGLEPYVAELVAAASVKLKRCLEQRIRSCLSRGCICPLRLQIKVGCWSSEPHSQDSDPESDHPDDIAWSPQSTCKIVELRARLGQPGGDDSSDFASTEKDFAATEAGAEEAPKTPQLEVEAENLEENAHQEAALEAPRAPQESVPFVANESMMESIERSLWWSTPPASPEPPTQRSFAEVLASLEDES